MTDIRACLDEGAGRLASAGIANPRREARLLLAHASGLSQVELIGYPERPVGARAEFERLVERRAGREPLSHLVGHREFWSLEFIVTPDTLDPRPDSEAVVEAALDLIPDTNAALRIADLGVGTGCLLAALLSMLPAATGVGVDRNLAAAVVANRNMAALGFSARARIVVGDWGKALAGGFDIVVANPPYIPSGEIELLQPEVSRHEPRSALDGGADGLDAVRRVVSSLPRLLAPGGRAVIEFGDGQRAAVGGIVAARGLRVAGERRDLADRVRCVVVCFEGS
jgi:release factor glutamine methyltransferase